MKKFSEFLTEMGMQVHGSKVALVWNRDPDDFSLVPGKGGKRNRDSEERLRAAQWGKKFEEPWIPAGAKPLVSKPSDLYGTVVYAVFSYDPANPVHTEILKGLKGQSGKLHVEWEDLEEFVRRAADFLWKTALSKEKIDVIVWPDSSSLLLTMFAEELAKKIPDALRFPDAAKKADPTKLRIDRDAIDAAFVGNESGKRRVIRSLEKAIERYRKTGEFKIHTSTGGQFKKFLRDWLDLDPRVFDAVRDKTVLLVDDFMTARTTMREMTLQLKPYGPKKIVGAVIMKAKNG